MITGQNDGLFLQKPWAEHAHAHNASHQGAFFSKRHICPSLYAIAMCMYHRYHHHRSSSKVNLVATALVAKSYSDERCAHQETMVASLLDFSSASRASSNDTCIANPHNTGDDTVRMLGQNAACSGRVTAMTRVFGALSQCQGL